MFQYADAILDSKVSRQAVKYPPCVASSLSQVFDNHISGISAKISQYFNQSINLESNNILNEYSEREHLSVFPSFHIPPYI